jgi:hypothetical protein
VATTDEATLTVQLPPPVLLTEANSDLAIAFDSVTLVRDPFPLTNPFNFSIDQRTRVTFFALNLDLLAGETTSAATVRAEDGALNVYSMTVEFLGTTPAVPGVSELTVLLPGNLPAGQDVFVTITLHGQTSNRARIRIR